MHVTEPVLASAIRCNAEDHQIRGQQDKKLSVCQLCLLNSMNITPCEVSVPAGSSKAAGGVKNSGVSILILGSDIAEEVQQVEPQCLP